MPRAAEAWALQSSAPPTSGGSLDMPMNQPGDPVANVCMYIYTHVTCMPVYTCACRTMYYMYIHTYRHTCTYAQTYTNVCVDIYIYIYLFIHLFIYVFINK